MVNSVKSALFEYYPSLIDCLICLLRVFRVFDKVCIEIRGRDRLGCQDQEASLLVQVKEWKLNEDNNLILIQMFE